MDKKFKKPYDASDPQEIEAQREKLELERERELNDLRFILKSPQGRRVFRRILAEARLFQSTFTGNSRGMFLEGRRDLGLFVLHEGATAAPTEMASVLIDMQGKEKKDG